jgi:hypothetical protein
LPVDEPPLVPSRSSFMAAADFADQRWSCLGRSASRRSSASRQASSARRAIEFMARTGTDGETRRRHQRLERRTRFGSPSGRRRRRFGSARCRGPDPGRP